MTLQVFRLRDGSLETARDGNWALERDIQSLCERNLKSLFGLQFVDSEVPVKGFRIDTLAFDSENKCFVILEYKRGANTSVIDQGFAYLNLVLSNEADFVLHYNKRLNVSFGKEDIDWKKTRVYFVAPSFTRYQREAVNFRDLPFDLWELSLFSDDIVILSHVGDEGGPGIVTGLAVDKSAEGVVVAPTPQQHLEGKPQEIRELYERLSAGLRSFHPDVQERAIIVAILFEYQGSRFAEIVPQKKQLVIHFDYYDGNPRGLMVRDLKAEGIGRYWAVGDYQVKIKPGDNISAVLDLLRASFDGLSRSP
jgi:predicted transport protein